MADNPDQDAAFQRLQQAERRTDELRFSSSLAEVADQQAEINEARRTYREIAGLPPE